MSINPAARIWSALAYAAVVLAGERKRLVGVHCSASGLTVWRGSIR